ncbi:MAG: MFS transporter [Chlamydiales bacterium]|nr:MFS transporter [Chlamydiia bacterium]MCP5507411.1 MFS transporter [Chlamydiales bacterium]
MSNESKKNVLVSLGLMWGAHFLCDFMIGIWPVYKTMVHLDLAVAGMIYGTCAFLGEGMQLFFGSLSDNGYRKTLVMCGLLGTVCSALLAYTQEYSYLFLLFMVVCLGSGAFHPSATSVIGTLTRRRKGLFITIFASGGAVGMAASQIVFSQVYIGFNGNTAFLMIPTLLLVATLYFTKVAGSYQAPKVGKKRIDFESIKKFFSKPELRNLYLMQVTNQTIFWATIFLLPDVLISRGYPNWISFGGAHMFFILGAAFMMVPSGYLADKYSSRLVLFVATLMGMTTFYMFLFVPYIESTMLLGSLLFVFGASVGVVNPVSVAFAYRMMPESPGIVSAVLMGLVWCVSEAIGPGGGGLLTTLFEQDAPAKALAILGTGFLVSIAVAARLPADAALEEEEEPAEA